MNFSVITSLLHPKSLNGKSNLCVPQVPANEKSIAMYAAYLARRLRPASVQQYLNIASHASRGRLKQSVEILLVHLFNLKSGGGGVYACVCTRAFFCFVCLFCFSLSVVLCVYI